MKQTIMKCLMPAVGLLAASAATAAELTLLVQGTGLEGKAVCIALYSSAHGFPRNENEARTAKVVATGNEVAFHFSGLPPGEYAAAAYADINGNARLDKNLIGIPTEPYGHSRDARGRAGPPDFADAAFHIGDADVTQTFHLR